MPNTVHSHCASVLVIWIIIIAVGVVVIAVAHYYVVENCSWHASQLLQFT